jgi:hypothetical protein
MIDKIRRLFLHVWYHGCSATITCEPDARSGGEIRGVCTPSAVHATRSAVHATPGRQPRTVLRSFCWSTISYANDSKLPVWGSSQYEVI